MNNSNMRNATFIWVDGYGLMMPIHEFNKFMKEKDSPRRALEERNKKLEICKTRNSNKNQRE